MTDLSVTFNTVSLPANTSGTITVYEDQTGDGNSDYSDTVSLSDGVTEYELTGYDASSGNDIWPEVELDNTNVEATATTAELLTIQTTTNSYTRNVAIYSGTESTNTTRSASKSRSAGTYILPSYASVSHSISKPRSPSSYVSQSVMDAVVDSGTMMRSATTFSSTLSGNTSAELSEVFPSESTAELDFDLITSPVLGFASEWVYEDSQFSGSEAFTTVFDIDLQKPITVRIQYDKDGDGTADYTTPPLLLKRENQVLSLDELGDPGYYRIIISGMRPGDFLRQITWGPTRY